jgi:hypothetical protein
MRFVRARCCTEIGVHLEGLVRVCGWSYIFYKL